MTDLLRSATLVVMIVGLVFTGYSTTARFHQNLGALALTRLIASKQADFAKAGAVEPDHLHQVLEYLDSAAARNPGDGSLSRLMAAVAYYRGDMDDAETWCLRALREAPDDPVSRLRLGYIYHLTDRPEQAVQAWGLARAAPYFVAQAKAHKAAGDMAGAREIYRRALAVDPSVVPTEMRIAMAQAYLDEGRAQEAEAEFLAAVNHATETDSNQWQAYAYGELGIFYWRQERWESSVEALQHSLDLTPGADSYRLWLGAAFRELGLFDRALAELSGVLATSDRTLRGYAYMNLGQTYQHLGNPIKAAESFSGAVALFPDNFDYRLNLAHAYADVGSLGDALEQYRQLLLLRPADKSLHGEYERIRTRMLTEGFTGE